MAKITKKYKNVEYVLTLSEEEARTLRVILSAVGGVPDATPRKYSNAVNRALADAGVEPIEAKFSEGSENLYFSHHY